MSHIVSEVEERERAKYRRAYATEEYRERSPGLRAAPDVWDYFRNHVNTRARMQDHDTLIDYGCGTGRAAKWFQDQGISVLGIDFCPEALEEPIPFLEGCLWDLPWCVPRTDYAYVSDVMEHIPAEHIMATLIEIASHTRKGAFFNVANGESKCGLDELHVTRWPFDRWLHEIDKFFDILDHGPGDRDTTYRIYCGARS